MVPQADIDTITCMPTGTTSQKSFQLYELIKNGSFRPLHQAVWSGSELARRLGHSRK